MFLVLSKVIYKDYVVLCVINNSSNSSYPTVKKGEKTPGEEEGEMCNTQFPPPEGGKKNSQGEKQEMMRR